MQHPLKQQTSKLIAGIILILCLAIGASPSAVAAPIAQEGDLDPVVRAAIMDGAAAVASAVGASEGTTLPPAKTPEADPSPEPTIEVEPLSGETTEYENAGITIAIPSEWEVIPGSSDSVFEIAAEDIGLKAQIQSFGDDFPGLIVLPIFSSQAPMLVQAFGVGAQLLDVARIDHPQNLPILRIRFVDAKDDGNPIDGVIYLIATGDKAYGVFAGAPGEAWVELEPIIEQAVTGMLVDEELITLQVVTDGNQPYDDPSGLFQLTIPEGWNVTATNDDELTMLFADPEINFVAAVGARSDLGDNSEMLTMLAGAVAGDLDDQTAKELMSGVLESMDMDAQSMNLDEEQTDFFIGTGDNLGIIRVGGAADIGDGASLPMLMYVAIQADAASAVVFFGDMAEVQAQEETLVEIINSLELTE